MNSSLASGYKSLSQKARVITEAWIEEEMYCPNCNSAELNSFPHGYRVFDFCCSNCEEQFQVKSSSKPIRNRIVDSAYDAMMRAVMSNMAPNLMVMHYCRDQWTVENLLLIPRHMIVPSIIEKRTPLSHTARRAGWIGCNFLIDRIPISGKIFAVRERRSRNPSDVRAEWNRHAFIKDFSAERRGWLVDILRCIQLLEKRRFRLDELYQFESELSELHPRNRHIKPKIRQQLQILRDKKMIRFVSRGTYELSSR